MLIKSILSFLALAMSDLVLSSPVDTMTSPDGLAARDICPAGFTKFPNICCPGNTNGIGAAFGWDGKSSFTVTACCRPAEILANTLNVNGHLHCSDGIQVEDPLLNCRDKAVVCGGGHTRGCCTGIEDWDNVQKA